MKKHGSWFLRRYGRFRIIDCLSWNDDTGRIRGTYILGTDGLKTGQAKQTWTDTLTGLFINQKTSGCAVTNPFGSRLNNIFKSYCALPRQTRGKYRRPTNRSIDVRQAYETARPKRFLRHPRSIDSQNHRFTAMVQLDTTQDAWHQTEALTITTAKYHARAVALCAAGISFSFDGRSNQLHRFLHIRNLGRF